MSWTMISAQVSPSVKGDRVEITEEAELILREQGYRQIFDGDCGLGGIDDETEKEAAEAWMRWSNLVSWDGSEPNGIAAMKQMLAEFGYERRER